MKGRPGHASDRYRCPISEPAVAIEPVAVKRATAARMLECGPTKIWELCKSGKLATIKVGADDRVTVDSIRRFVADGGGK
jgi:hypothetical protein